MKDVLSTSEADLILFPGHTVENKDDLKKIRPLHKHNGQIAILEVRKSKSTSVMTSTNALYMFNGTKFVDLYTSQIFSAGGDVQNNKVLIEKLFDEMPRRQFTCCDKRITILQCGETALLSCSQKNGNRASFRFADDENLNKRYESMLADTEIFLNPIHTPQGEQSKMKQRRKTLSGDGRYYFSTCSSNSENEKWFMGKSIQYACFDGEEFSTDVEVGKRELYASRVFEI